MRSLNPRRHSPFRHPRSSTAQEMGGWCDPLGVSKVSVVELSGKHQRIAFDECLRLVLRFLTLGQSLTQLWGVNGQFSWNRQFFILTGLTLHLLNVSKWNFHHRVLRSILSRVTYCFGTLIKYLWCGIASRKETTSRSPGKSPGGKRGERPWLTSETLKEPSKRVHVKNEPRILFQNLKKPPKPPI